MAATLALLGVSSKTPYSRLFELAEFYISEGEYELAWAILAVVDA